MSNGVIATNFAEIFVVQRRSLIEGKLIPGQEEHWIDWSTPATEVEAEDSRDKLSDSYPECDWRAVRKIIMTITLEVL